MAEPSVAFRNSVCEVTLCEPQKHNPLSPEVLPCLEQVVRKLQEDRSTRLLLLRGRGVSFSSGADLRSKIPRAQTWAESRYLHGRWQRVIAAIEALPQTSVAELHGNVFGGALLLALSCDLRIAADDTRFCIPELRLGIPLTWAGLPLLVREIGLPRTRDLVMSGRIVGANEAYDWGLATRLAPRADLETHTLQLIGELLSVPEAPLAMTKDALAAIGRDRMGFTGWADPDLSLWSRQENESVSARQKYVDALAATRSRRADPTP